MNRNDREKAERRWLFVGVTGCIILATVGGGNAVEGNWEWVKAATLVCLTMVGFSIMGIYFLRK